MRFAPPAPPTPTPDISITALLIYHGPIDWWQGEQPGDRAALLHATYGPGTTTRELVDEWCGEFEAGGGCDDWPEAIETSHVRAALLALLTDRGRDDYESDRPCELSESLDPELWDHDDASDTTWWPCAIVHISYGKAA